MRKVFLLLILIGLTSCSSDDSGNSNDNTISVTVVDIQYNQAAIEWTRPSQAEGNVIYDIVLNNEVIETNRTGTQYVIRNLSPMTEYTGFVKALDERGKETFGNFNFTTRVIGGTEVHIGGYSLRYQFQVDNLAASNITTITGELSIHGSDIVDLSPLTDLISVGSLRITQTSLPNLDGLDNVTLSEEQKRLIIWGNGLLENITAITVNNSEFDQITLQDNNAFNDLSGIRMSEFGSLRLSGLGITSLAGLQTANSIESLELKYLNQLTDISALQTLSNIGTLEIYKAHNLNSLSGLQNLSNCGTLKIRLADGLSSVDILSGLNSCSYLSLIQMENLSSLHGFESLGRLDKLELSNLPNITSFQGLHNVEEIGMIQGVFAGETVVSINDLGITDLSGLQNMTRIRNIQISYNDNLTSLDGTSLTNSWNMNTDKRLQIFWNPLLSDYCGFTEFVQNANLNAWAIYGNAYNPNIDQIKNPAECSQ